MTLTQFVPSRGECIFPNRHCTPIPHITPARGLLSRTPPQSQSPRGNASTKYQTEIVSNQNESAPDWLLDATVVFRQFRPYSSTPRGPSKGEAKRDRMKRLQKHGHSQSQSQSQSQSHRLNGVATHGHPNSRRESPDLIAAHIPQGSAFRRVPCPSSDIPVQPTNQVRSNQPT